MCAFFCITRMKNKRYGIQVCVTMIVLIHNFKVGKMIEEVKCFCYFQVFDAFVVFTSLILDCVFYNGEFKSSSTIILLLLPWRIIRMFNSKLFF